jgi:hypothetical protein
LGRTFPTSTMALDQEQAEWKPFRKHLDKSERKHFDALFDIPRLYISSCMYSAYPVTIYPILMSMIFHHQKELVQLLQYVEQLTGERYNITTQ